MLHSVHEALANTESHLLSLRTPAGHWEGELASSALSTATAIVALHCVDSISYGTWIQSGAKWLIKHQNTDGGWGDTTISKSNLSTTLLCWSALRKTADTPESAEAVRRCDAWIQNHVGSLEPEAISRAVIARYGKDKTFSVPILMLCAIGGTLGENAWRRVLPLPFELAALPREWFGAIGLPVVSYALPALIAIGHARFYHAPPAWWNPLRWVRAALWPRISPMLKLLQPSTGGYLEATPLTSFVTMALASAGEKYHPCVPDAVAFLKASMRQDGSWPIDTNLATWGTTMAMKSLAAGEAPPADSPAAEAARACLPWVLGQHYDSIHPFTNAAPGGWAWTDLPGGVPDADDTPGALIALHPWAAHDAAMADHAARGTRWLLDLQNRDGGIPTFCRGWGTLPFDRSTPELTAHALLAWWLWEPLLPPALREEVQASTLLALAYLKKVQRPDGSWIPLWFGNEHTHDEENPVYGTAQVVAYLTRCPALATQAEALISSGLRYLEQTQKADGSWGGDLNAPSSLEETAVCLHALALQKKAGRTWNAEAVQGAALWLAAATRNGTHFPAAPIGLYFARLWYHEKLYPIVWTLQALRSAKAALPSVHVPATTAATIS